MGSSGWNEMSCSEKMAVVFMCITVVAVIFTLFINIYVMVIADQNSWFIHCSECSQNGGTRTCRECCQDCSGIEGVYFYINRVFAVIICAICLIAEFKWKKFLEFCQMCRWYFPRGFLLMFLGFWTVQGGIADPRAGAEINFTAVVGYILIGVAILNFILELCCLSERGLDNADDKEEEDTQMQARAPPVTGQAAGPPRPGTNANTI